jgi:hypothetical protein
VIDEQRFPVGMLDITDVLQRVENAERSLKAGADTVTPIHSGIRSAS